MTAGDLLYAWLVILALACVVPALLGAIEVLLCWYQRRTAFRGLPAPDLPDLRARRAVEAYERNQSAAKALR